MKEKEKLLLKPQFPRGLHRLRKSAIPAPRSPLLSTSVSFCSHLCLVPLTALASCAVLRSQTKEGWLQKNLLYWLSTSCYQRKTKAELDLLLLFWVLFFPFFWKRDSSSLWLLYILTAPAGNLLGLFKTGLKTQFSALAQLKRITSALFSASQLFNPESHVTSNYEYDFHVPLGPKFHPSKSSHSAARETCQKQWSSSTESALGEIKLSQPELSECQASFPLLLIVVDTLHPLFLSPLVWNPGMAKEGKKKSLLSSKHFWDWCFLHLWGQRENKDTHELVMGKEKLSHLIKLCFLSSPGTALCWFDQ